MRNIVKNLKPYWKTVIIILLLLMVQAYCDLALPSYTQDIIDTGIQAGGVTHVLPERITEGDFNASQLFMTEEEKALWQDSYSSEAAVASNADDGSNAGNPNTSDGEAAVAGVLFRNDMTETELDDLDNALLTPLVMGYQAIRVANGEGLAGGDTVGGDAPGDTSSGGVMTGSYTREQMEAMIETIGDSTLRSIGLAYAREMEGNAGIDTDAKQMSYLWAAGGRMFLMAGFMMLAMIAASYFASRTGASVGRDLRSKVYRNVIGFSNAEMDKFSTASLITRSTNDVQQVQMVTTMMLRMVLFAPIMGIGSIIKVWRTGTGMSWIIVIGVAIIMCILMVLFKVAMPKFRKMQELVDDLNLVSREILTGLSVIRAFSREKTEEERFDKANTNLKNNQLFVNRTMTFMMPLMMLIMNGLVIAIMWVGSNKIDAGTLQVGAMTAFISYSMQVVMSFLMITAMSIMLPRAGVAADRINEVVNTDSSILEPENPVASTESKGRVRFSHVDFRYDGADHNILNDIDFTAEPGETTAIIGSTGSGKTTLINLIPRFFDVTGGKITVDGIDVRDMDLKTLRDMIGLVPQKGVLFSGTIASNLRFGGEDITEERIKEAAEIAQATEFIDAKEEGFDSAISQGGSNVSGGQKQRLAIARAIAKDPKIYIFDDSFSALDMKTDAALRKALAGKVSGATVIIVAQRISTIMNADKILVMDEGRIVGMGTHEELLNTCDVYYQIASSQLSPEELGKGVA